MAVYTAEMEEITKLLKALEDIDMNPDLKHVSVKSGIEIIRDDEDQETIGRLVAIDGGIWAFEAAPE